MASATADLRYLPSFEEPLPFHHQNIMMLGSVTEHALLVTEIHWCERLDLGNTLQCSV